jgi:hypothetical protein
MGFDLKLFSGKVMKFNLVQGFIEKAAFFEKGKRILNWRRIYDSRTFETRIG